MGCTTPSQFLCARSGPPLPASPCAPALPRSSSPATPPPPGTPSICPHCPPLCNRSNYARSSRTRVVSTRQRSCAHNPCPTTLNDVKCWRDRGPIRCKTNNKRAQPSVKRARMHGIKWQATIEHGNEINRKLVSLLLVRASEAGERLCQCRHVTAQLQRNLLRLFQEQLHMRCAAAHRAAASVTKRQHARNTRDAAARCRGTPHASCCSPPNRLTCSSCRRSPGQCAAAADPAR